jgi:hypothetical protein
LLSSKNFDTIVGQATLATVRMTVSVPQAIVLERNKLVLRRIARVLGCAGFEVRTFEEPDKIDTATIEAAELLMADAFDADLVMKHLRAHASLRAALYSGEPLDRLLGKALEEPRLVGLLGRASFETPPREDDLLHVARRAITNASPPFEAHLAWGAAGFAFSLTDMKGRDHAVNETIAFAGKLGAPNDEFGRPRFAHDRKAEINLSDLDAAEFRCGSDGVRIAVEIVDRFGRLERKHVFGGLVRGLKAGQMDTAGGGAGLGMLVAYRSTTALFYDVDPGLRTRVTGLFDLDLNLREFRLLPKTIHFPEGT